MDSCQTVFNFAQTMTFRGLHPLVKHFHKPYPTGVKLTQTQMALLELRFERLVGLAKWFIRIPPFQPLPCSDILLE